MTLEEMKKSIEARLEMAVMNGRNEAIGKKRRIFHDGKAEAYRDVLWLLNMVEKTAGAEPFIDEEDNDEE